MDADTLMREVDSTVAANNHLVVLRAMQMADSWRKPCSYAIHLGRYVTIKLQERRLIERYEHNGQMHSVAGVALSRLQYELSCLRAALYRYPCMECSTCKGRRKPWPMPRKPAFVYRAGQHNCYPPPRPARDYENGRAYGEPDLADPASGAANWDRDDEWYRNKPS